MSKPLTIDDSLMQELQAQAEREALPISTLLERMIRHGLSAKKRTFRPADRYTQRTFSLGAASAPLDKAMSLADAYGDEEAIERLNKP